MREKFYFMIMLICIIIMGFINGYNYLRAEKEESLLKFYLENTK